MMVKTLLQLSDRDLDIIKYVARSGGVYYSDLVKYVSQKYGIGSKAVSNIVNRLVDDRILWRRRVDNKLFIDIDPNFISFIVEMYALLTKLRHRIKYHERKVSREEDVEDSENENEDEDESF